MAAAVATGSPRSSAETPGGPPDAWAPPAPDRLFAALEATWPPADIFARPPWRIRRGDGGGKRVSAATLAAPFEGSDADLSAAIAGAEDAMDGLGQTPLFMIREGDRRLDAALARGRTYEILDRTVFLAADIRALLRPIQPLRAIEARTELAVTAEIWAEAGIGPGRLAVMARAKGEKVALLGRLKDEPAGVVFAALDGDVAMVHALEIRPSARRSGLGADLVAGAARFAAERGATVLALAVTEANAPARALYEKLGFSIAGRYHYRHLKEMRP